MLNTRCNRSFFIGAKYPCGCLRERIRKELVACCSPEHRIDEENQDEQNESPIYIAGAAVLHRSGMLPWKRELHRTTKVSLLCRFPGSLRAPISSILLGCSLTNIKFINGPSQSSSTEETKSIARERIFEDLKIRRPSSRGREIKKIVCGSISH